MGKKYAAALVILLLIAAAGIAAWVVMKNEKHGEAPSVEIIQNGVLLKTVPLSEDIEFTIECGDGSNTVTIRDGAVMVSRADCPDLVCVKTGAISGGAVPIICLPHRLEIRVVNGEDVEVRV